MLNRNFVQDFEDTLENDMIKKKNCFWMKYQWYTNTNLMLLKKLKKNFIRIAFQLLVKQIKPQTFFDGIKVVLLVDLPQILSMALNDVILKRIITFSNHTKCVMSMQEIN